MWMRKDELVLSNRNQDKLLDSAYRAIWYMQLECLIFLLNGVSRCDGWLLVMFHDCNNKVSWFLQLFQSKEVQYIHFSD